LKASDFTSSSIAKGADYQRQGRASIIDEQAQDGGWALESRVRGGMAAYRQSIEISPDEAGIGISGSCSCPVGFNCKHVVAAVMQWRREAAGNPARSPVGPIGRSAPGMANESLPTLSAPLAQWVAELGNDLWRADESAVNVRKRLFYLLMPRQGGGLGVDIVSRDLGGNGQPQGAPRAYDINNATSVAPAKFLRASDLALLPRLARTGYSSVGSAGRYHLSGRDGSILLTEIIQTGRAHWLAIDGLRLFLGVRRAGSGVWRVGEDSAQRFSFEPAGVKESIAFALGSPHYIDLQTGEIGVIDTALPDQAACRLLSAPPVPPEQADVVAQALSGVLPPQAAPLPANMGPIAEARPRPSPRARLTMKDMPGWRFEFGFDRLGSSAAPKRVPAIDLVFDYDGTRFSPDDPRADSSQYDGTSVRRVHRNRVLEARSLKRLSRLGLQPLSADWRYGRSDRPSGVMWLGGADPAASSVRLLLDVKPQLEADGWAVEVDPEFPLRLAVPDQERFSLDVREPSAEEPGVDWFDLSLGVMIDGERLDLLPAFTQLLSRLPAGRELDALEELVKNAGGTQGRLVVPLSGGRILPLSLDRVAPILASLLSIWGSAELAEGPKLHPAQARDLADLEASLAGHVELVGGTRLKALAEELAAFRDRPPAELPAWFGGSLRPYQQAGVDWLQMLSRTGFGGVLADDMGLGKTVQLLAHLSIEKEAGRLDAPALVVAPTSVLGNWHAEARRFAPAVTVLVHQGLRRAKEQFDTAGIDVVVTSYPLLARDRRFLVDRRWSIAALDEAQTIRNPQAATSLAAFALDAGQRIALSGTPVENHLGDVWSLMRFLNPGLLGDARTFRTLYRTPIEKGSDAGARTRLSRRLKPFMLRRTKAEVAADLPEKTEIRENVTLTPAQHQLYEATRLVMQRKVREALDQRGLAKSAIIVLDALLKLRQACCDPRLVKSAAGKVKAGDSAKLARLVELLVELKEERRSALIFSQFTSMLDLIRAELDARGWHYAWLTGDTVDRATPVARFQAGEVDVFLISLKAGGVGLNLTRADTVILYDPWWNPAVEAQAIDRAHRIGQSRKVFIHRLIAEGTVEEKMLELQARKRGLAEALWEGGAGGFAGLTDADVQGLFE